jgi:hypothetical protein
LADDLLWGLACILRGFEMCSCGCRKIGAKRIFFNGVPEKTFVNHDLPRCTAFCGLCSSNLFEAQVRHNGRASYKTTQ